MPSISENGGSATGTVTRSNTDIGLPLTVQLTSDDASEATVPVTVTILANQSSATFAISAVDDALLDGTQTVVVSASASGYSGGTRSINVDDAETLTVSINVPSISENGGSATGTVTRSNTDIALPLTIQLTSDEPSEATVPVTVTIPANQSSATFTISAADDSLLDGSQTVLVSAAAGGYSGGSQSLTVLDFEQLLLTINTPAISESGGSAMGTVTRSNTDLGLPLTIQLTSDDASEATVPTTVTILANESSATFAITAADDALLDGVQTVSITVSAAGYAQGGQSLSVTDSEALTLDVSATSMSEKAGRVRATLARSNTDREAPLTVAVVNADASELTAPVNVTIPANQTSVEFELLAVDDGLFDGDQTVGVTVQALGYASAARSVTVIDFVRLSLTIDAAGISEKGGTTMGTLRRSNTDIASPLVVQIAASDTSEVAVPGQVTIPANASTVQFAIQAVDDVLLDGQQPVTIEVSSPGYQADSQSIQVTDAESLTLTVDVTSIAEKNGLAVATVARSNSDNSAPLVVTLANSDATEVTVPSSVIIPAGQSFVTFGINSINDRLVDGAQTVQIDASAAGYESGTLDVTVLDDDRAFPWQSPRNPLDVNDSGQVTAIDALLVINGLNSRMVLTPELPDPFIPVAYVDVNGDGFLTPIDALLVINELNSPGSGEGEAIVGADPAPMLEELPSDLDRRRSRRS